MPGRRIPGFALDFESRLADAIMPSNPDNRHFR
jgi:hypothetical protein